MLAATKFSQASPGVRKPPAGRACIRRPTLVPKAHAQPVTGPDTGLLSALVELEAAGVNGSAEEVAPKLMAVKELAKALGANKVPPEQMHGYFRGVPLTGPLLIRSSSDNAMPVSALTGGALKLPGIKLEINRDAPGRSVWSGLLDGLQTHIVVTNFRLREHPGVWGVHEMRLDMEVNGEGDPQGSTQVRMKLREAVLTPDFSPGTAAELLPVWMKLVARPAAAEGASVNPTTGEIRAPVTRNVESCLEVVAATPEVAVYAGNKSGSHVMYWVVDGPFSRP